MSKREEAARATLPPPCTVETVLEGGKDARETLKGNNRGSAAGMCGVWCR